jgi:short-subunit dehydrogenase
MARPRLVTFALAAAGLAVLAPRLRRRRRPRTTLRGAVALVTGGSRGFGLALARELGRRGARPVICARDEEELERARATLAAEGIEVVALPCDVSDEEGVQGLVADVTEALGAVDILVNNAGIIQVGPAESMRLEDYRHSMDVLFWGAAHATEAVLPQMRARRRGTIVNITSIGGAVAVPHLAPYVAAKFALRGYSEALGAELHKQGIRVVTVVPWLMRTGSFGHALVKGERHVEANLFALFSTIPVLTTSAERAARRVVRAIEGGERFVEIGLAGKLLRLAHDLFPGATIAALGVVNRFLPAPADPHPEELPLPVELFRRGLARSVLTALGDRAARRWNEEPT